jgi:prepilin-type N-terminal cleavage/methylation domain-containing protein
MRKQGFTLIELMVVIVIIIILAGSTVALLNVFFRGQGVRQGAMIVQQALAQAKQLAADKRTVHFVVFSNDPAGDGGKMQIYQDTGTPPNKQWDPADIEVPERAYPLPKYVVFQHAPAWIGIEPSGYCLFSSNAIPSGGFTEVQASAFEGALAANSTAGDIILNMLNKTYKMCIDVDRASGKARRHHFLNQ